jgi:hypothetical protein
MKRVLIVLSIISLLAAAAFPALAQEMTADEIVKKAEDIMRGSSNIGVMSMHIITPMLELPRMMSSAFLTISSAVISWARAEKAPPASSATIAINMRIRFIVLPPCARSLCIRARSGSRVFEYVLFYFCSISMTT